MKRGVLLLIVTVSVFLLGCGIDGGTTTSAIPGGGSGDTGGGGIGDGGTIVIPPGTPTGSITVLLPGSGVRALNPVLPLDNQARGDQNLTDHWAGLGDNGVARIVLRNTAYAFPTRIQDNTAGNQVRFNDIPSVPGYTLEVVLSQKIGNDYYMLKYGSRSFNVQPGENNIPVDTRPIWSYLFFTAPPTVLTSTASKTEYIDVAVSASYPLRSSYYIVDGNTSLSLDNTYYRDNLFIPTVNDILRTEGTVRYTVPVDVPAIPTGDPNTPWAPYRAMFFQARFYIDNTLTQASDGTDGWKKFYVNCPDVPFPGVTTPIFPDTSLTPAKPKFTDNVVTRIAPQGSVIVPISSPW